MLSTGYGFASSPNIADHSIKEKEASDGCQFLGLEPVFFQLLGRNFVYICKSYVTVQIVYSFSQVLKNAFQNDPIHVPIGTTNLFNDK